MFTKNTFKVFFVAVILFLLGASVYFNPSFLIIKAQTGKTKESQQDPRIEKVANYKTWMLINPKPVMMDKTVAVMCAAAAPFNPHADKYISVYVNDIGKHAMLDEKKPRFPIGTTIVKEKLAKEVSDTPELLTVMIKREEGFNKENGDWEFLVFNAAATKIEKSNEASCMRCHVGYKEQDYVVRNYLTDETQKKLK